MALMFMLLASPLSSRLRQRVMVVYLLSASVSGLIGALQYFGALEANNGRAHGLAHPIHYATLLAFACGVSVLGLLGSQPTLRVRALMVMAAAMSFMGILLSLTRGVWVALSGALLFTLVVISPRKALLFLAALVLATAVLMASSPTMRERTSSIFTSAFTESSTGSTGTRLELWKGAILIAKEHPLLGTGWWDFEPDIRALVEDGRIERPQVAMHAHSIYFHWLATGGVLGLAALAALLTALAAMAKTLKTYAGAVALAVTLVIIIGGFTENNLGISKILSAYCFTFGLFGGMRTDG